MNYHKNTNIIKRELLVEVARLLLQDRLKDNIDRLPLKLFPKNKNSMRCCVYKDRAITKYRLLAIMGHRIENETDELKPLSVSAGESLQRENPQTPALTVIDEACSACSKARHFVTNACRGCVARVCVVNCPKNAVQIVDGQAVIDGEKCIDCGKCLKACPYHAIVHIPIPCEDACPVNAIFKDDNGCEKIDYDKCIFCGNCMRECPFGAIMECSQMVDVLNKIKNGRKTVAMIAPAIAGQFPVDFNRLASALIKLGFDKVVEVASGAEVTARHEANELFEKLNNGFSFMTSSCCPAYVQFAKKHADELHEYVSDTPTPLHYTAEMIKENDPSCITVFIGPCVAKRVEAAGDDNIDYVITTEELGAMFVAADIEVAECSPVDFDLPAGKNGRAFAMSGGVTKAVMSLAENDSINPTLIDGLDKSNIRQLKKYAKGDCPYNFIEVMSCKGGCVAGPCNINNPRNAEVRIRKILNQNGR